MAERELRRQIEIDAAAAEVWAVLTATDDYPRWNPFIRRLDGVLREGERLDVRIEPPGGRAMTFKPTVLAVRPERELRWIGHLVMPGLFDGEHRFVLEDTGGSGTRFTHAERFTGVLVPLFGGTLAKTAVGFEQMNEALKAEVEAAN